MRAFFLTILLTFLATIFAAAQFDASRLRTLAEGGDPNAACRLGTMYELGQGGLAHEDTQAAYWYRKGADGGNTDCQTALGLMYVAARGGLPHDDTQALYWFRRASEQGHPAAQSNLALMYLGGRGGLPKDDAQAVFWFRRAGEQGNLDAQMRLGGMYSEGRAGLPQDDKQAVYWYRKAAEQGDKRAQYNLGLAYSGGLGSLTKDDTIAVYWFRKSADQGLAEGQAALGVMYESGSGGLTKDDAQAVYWFRKAADQNQPGACIMLARYLSSPDPRFRDPAKAVQYALTATRLKKSAVFLDTLARAYHADSQFQNAVETEQEALALAPAPAEKKKEYQSMLETYQRARDFSAWRALPVRPPLPQQVREQRLLAESAFQEKKLAQALLHYEVGLEAYPTWPQGQSNAANIAAELGYYAEAVKRMQAYLELVPDAPDAQDARDQIVIWREKAKQTAPATKETQ